jgi:hypothetical protein
MTHKYQNPLNQTPSRDQPSEPWRPDPSSAPPPLAGTPTPEGLAYLREQSKEKLDLSDIPAWMWLLLIFIAINFVSVAFFDMYIIPIPRFHG